MTVRGTVAAILRRKRGSSPARPADGPRQDVSRAVPTVEARRRFIERHADTRRARILEIGAMDNPTFPDRDTRFLDWFTRDELRAAIAAKRTRRADRVVHPDYVVKGKRFASEVPEQFDLIVANHVVEHIADPIGWLRELRTLAPGGSLFLAVPDRRYTFDYLRPESTLGDLLRAHEEDLERPTRWQMFDSILYHRPIRAHHAWRGELSGLEKARYSVDEALERSRRAEREYVDVHCHVFTATTFAALARDLAPITGWFPAEVTDVARGSNEFHAWLVGEDRREGSPEPGYATPGQWAIS